MNKLINGQKFMRIIQALRPWLTAFALVLILRYTGMLSGISSVAGNALMLTGAMDYSPSEATKKNDFDYNFILQDLNGNKIDFNQYKGKVVFINLWATWCGPCRMEMPSIQNLYNSIGENEKIAFVMLALDQPGTQEKIGKFVKEKEYNFPIFTPAGNLPKQLQVSTIPTTLVIGPDGKIASQKVGAANYDTEKFRSFLKDLASK
ncbi:MAG: TlpA family protein disulfide reductase [Cyclobacteriaceae bacterium]|nr:TlpA family protein disulfide reductase [Cyclobacteriaceae bacterium]